MDERKELMKSFHVSRQTAEDFEKLRLDLFTEVVNWEDMRHFQLAMFKSGLPYLDAPQDIAFIGVPHWFAVGAIRQ